MINALKLIFCLFAFTCGAVFCAVGIFEVDYTLMISGLMVCLIVTVYAWLLEEVLL